MNLEDEILVNKYGQGLIVMEQLTSRLYLLDLAGKKSFLTDIVYLIMQSKPKKEDIEPAIEESKLKPTFTPCVLLRQGIASHNLQKIVGLPERELEKAFVLFMSLFKIAYRRRFEAEKNISDKWWYWDLSDNRNVEMIIKLRSQQ